MQPILDALQGKAKAQQQRHRTLDMQILRARMRANRSPSTVETPGQAQKFLNIVRKRPKGELYKREIPLARKAQALTPPPRQADPRRSLIEHQDKNLGSLFKQELFSRQPTPRIRPAPRNMPATAGTSASKPQAPPPDLPTTMPPAPALNPKRLPIATQR